MLKILHLAPQNYAGVPYSFFEMHNSCGDYSRLITYHKNQLNFPEDICLNFPLPVSGFAAKWRKRKVLNTHSVKQSTAPLFKPRNIIEAGYFKLNDISRKTKVKEIINKYDLNSFDIIHYDAGLDLFRDSSQAAKWKKEGKKIVCCYYGSDLRTRGIIKALDELSDLNITSEYDHLALKMDLHYLFYPYNPFELPAKKINDSGKIKIVHSPTNRIYKGTALIIEVMEKLKKEKKIDFILLENVPRSRVLEVKSESDICIDQVGGIMGGTGYGKAGLESLAMGIPTITNMTDDYAKWLPENPFVVANNSEELYSVLNNLIDNEELRNESAVKGKAWVTKYHGYEQVDKKLKELYRLKNII
jgi:hypothetical protein